MSTSAGKEGWELTRSKQGWDFVKHVSVEVGMDGPVGGSVVACGDEDRVPLSGGDADEVNRALLNVRLREGGVRRFGREMALKRLAPSTSMIRISCPSIQK